MTVEDAALETEPRARRPLLGDESWQKWGSCRLLTPEVFYPEDGGRAGLREREEKAKRVCRGCPVLAECRDHALATREAHGVWGALSARDRARALSAQGWPARR